tara:strand:+ start:435 stop:1037 length:603 start_codon:yes stop_codon:yes gene_type:complete
MGMFDDIVVPKSYLKGLLDKEYEKLLKTRHVFQTKSLESLMDCFKVHRQTLYTRTRPSWGDSKKGKGTPEKWEKVDKTIAVVFYDDVINERGDSIWLEFEFSFVGGKLDKKKLIKAGVRSTKEQKDSIDAMWDKEQEILDKYRNHSIKYKFFTFLEKRLQKATNWARKKHGIPLSLRKEAYKESGRLKRDPDCLSLYLDS